MLHDASRAATLTLDELLEVVLHFAVYAGWPKASHLEMVLGMQWAAVHEARGETPPPWPTVDPDPGTHRGRPPCRGEREVRGGQPVPAPPADSPYRGAVVEWVFGDLWYRPGISRRDRRLVSITCAALSGAPSRSASTCRPRCSRATSSPAAMDDVVGQVTDAVGADRARPLADAVERARTAAS